jgi:ubiquinone biosynthesis protein UbiJ
MSEPSTPPKLVLNADTVDRVFEAVRTFVERRIEKSEADLAATLKELETVLERHSPADVQRLLTRMSEHVARLETRIQALERKP